MKIRDLVETASAGAMSAGAVAPVAQPLGAIQKRVIEPVPNKYSNAAPKYVRKTVHAKR